MKAIVVKGRRNLTFKEQRRAPHLAADGHEGLHNAAHIAPTGERRLVLPIRLPRTSKNILSTGWMLALIKPTTPDVWLSHVVKKARGASLDDTPKTSNNFP